MGMRGEGLRFGLPVAGLALFAAYTSYRLVTTQLAGDTVAPRYEFERELAARRGSIYDRGGTSCPLVQSVPMWEYRLDPVDLTNRVVRQRGEPPRRPEAIVRTIADALGLDYAKTLAMSRNTANRYQLLGRSADPEAHRIIADSRAVAGVAILDIQPRSYLHGKTLAHVLGSVNQANEPSSGLELKFNRELAGVPGRIRGKRDARRRELYDKRIETVAPIPGADLHLTIDHNLQYEVETALRDGLAEYGAASGWSVVLDAETGAVLAMASLPDFHPVAFGRTADAAKINRTMAYTYEPGSVMKVITAAAAIDAGFVRPDSLYSTDRDEEGYYRLPGDGRHVWEPRMSVADAIVHSSNIVIGKLGYDFGPDRLWAGMAGFGFGARTGVELPGEEVGILRSPDRWDLATRSRAAIGQGVSVTALQIASAYQAIANGGVRMKPYIIDRIVAADGTELVKNEPRAVGRPISRETSETVREVMLGVASPEGTARRAAIRGYSVAGKTGTAQKARNGHYVDGLYRATFCGIVPSGVVRRHPEDLLPVPPRFVVLVTLDFEECRKYHQGGNSAAPVFRRISTAALRYFAVEPDKPEELMEYLDDDEFDRVMDERAEKHPEYSE